MRGPPSLTFLERKVSQRASRRLYQLIPAKVLCVGVWGRQPQHSIRAKKARRCRAFFICQNVLELSSKPCFKGLFVKSPLKIRKNFPTFSHFIRAKISKLLLHGNILYIKFDIFYFCCVNAAELYQHIP